MKGRQGKVQDFILPLSKQAVTILRLLQKLNRCNSKFVFPSKKIQDSLYRKRRQIKHLDGSVIGIF